MILVALTAQGLEQALRVANGSPVWCSAQALPESEFRARAFQNLMRFDHSVATPELLAGALATLAEHRPGECVFVEARGGSDVRVAATDR